jgi:hypothetical protein
MIRILAGLPSRREAVSVVAVVCMRAHVAKKKPFPKAGNYGTSQIGLGGRSVPARLFYAIGTLSA